MIVIKSWLLFGVCKWVWRPSGGLACGK